MTEYVDIYYDGMLRFQRIRKEDVEGVIQECLDGGVAESRKYDRTKFSVQPTKFEEEVPPVAGMSSEDWRRAKERRVRENLDLKAALLNGFYVQEAGKVRMAHSFTKTLDVNCRIHSNLQDEEMLYRVMISIREFSPDISDSDFVVVRRVVFRNASFLRERWKRNHPDEQKESPEAGEKRLEEVRGRWVGGFKDAKKRDMLTLVYDMQLDNARKVIGDGANFQPELLMCKGREVAVTFIQGPDPMTQAIALLKQARPEGYSFAAEAWTAPKGIQFKHEKWGDIAKLEGKTEAFTQTCAENNGPILARRFLIDRANKTLVLEGRGGLTRMPRIWELEEVRPRGDSNAGGPYA